MHADINKRWNIWIYTGEIFQVKELQAIYVVFP